MIKEIEDIKVLLKDTNRIIQHQEEIKILRGENFNVFSILKMESKENATHSAFLGELLNPDGSHLLKNIFLKHFLVTIGYKGALDINTAKLKLEHHIGFNDIVNKEGGRIDIYIWDNNGNSISIENKIYAGDQGCQIQRYVNHNTAKNTVYYLTLKGDDASENSRGTLKVNEDYYCLSYSEIIIKWLNICLKEAAEQAILRETIKQYILLINKLTHQLSDHKMSEEIQELIKKNYSAAKVIAGNIYKVELEATYSLLCEIKNNLELVLTDNWNIELDEDLDQSYSGLRIRKSTWGEGVNLKLEGGSKMPWGYNYYGIQADIKIWERTDLKNKFSNSALLKQFKKDSPGWPYYDFILDLRTDKDRSQLFDSVFKKELTEKITNQLLELARECEVPLSNLKPSTTA
jgi:hypothetical protein